MGGIGQQQIAASIAQNPSLLLGYGVFVIVSVIVGGLSLLAVLLACGHLITGENAQGQLPTGELYRLALGRLGAYVVLVIIFGLLVLPLFILFPLGIFLIVRWSVSVPALALERKGPFAALRRSWNLTRGAWWHTLGIILIWIILAGILEILAFGIVGGVGGVLTLSGNPVVGSIVSTIVGLLLGLLIAPISLSIYAVLYYELRARHEGFDLALRAQPAPNA